MAWVSFTWRHLLYQYQRSLSWFLSAHYCSQEFILYVVSLLPSAVRRHQAMAGKLMVAEQSQTVRMSAAARVSDILVG